VLTDMSGLVRFLDLHEFSPSSLADSVITPFAPTFAVELMVVAFYARQRLLRQHDATVDGMSSLCTLNPTALWVLPLQLWCLQASLRAISFFDMLAWSHGPEPGEGLTVLFHSLVALGMILLVQGVAIVVIAPRGDSLGLTGRQRNAITYAFLAIVLDAFLLQAVARWPIDNR